jgi:large subunit ribosomal protein L35
MPKMKTHKATAKRIRLTGSGKLVRKQAGLSHILAKKTGARKRRLGKLVVVARADVKRIGRLLNNGGAE